MIRQMIALIVVAFAVNPVSAGLIANGSFETPVTSTYLPVPAGDLSIPSWTVGLTGVDVVSINNGFTVGPAYEGVQYLDLDGTPGPGSVAQSFATAVGGNYTLTFAYANNYVDSSSPSADYSISDSLGNILGPTTITHSTSVAGNLNWTVLSVNFAAREATTNVLFSSLSGQGVLGGIMLDGVSVDPATAGVPEPSSIVMFGFGAFSLLAARRRKDPARTNVDRPI